MYRKYGRSRALTQPSEPKRRYDTGRRRDAAARNREAVLAAGRELLLARGYQGTTIRVVAERAGVSPELVYKGFGGKQGLMKAVYDTALAGDDEPVPVGARPAVRRIWAMADPEQKVRAYAGFVTDLMERLGGLVAVLAEADPELAAVCATTEEERLRGVRGGAGCAPSSATSPRAAAPGSRTRSTLPRSAGCSPRPPSTRN